MLCYKYYCVWNRDLSIHWRLCITSDHWMSHVMQLKSIFGSTMFGIPLIRDIWFFYSCVSSSSWFMNISIRNSYCFMFFCNVSILLYLVCVFFVCCIYAYDDDDSVCHQHHLPSGFVMFHLLLCAELTMSYTQLGYVWKANITHVCTVWKWNKLEFCN